MRLLVTLLHLGWVMALAISEVIELHAASDELSSFGTIGGAYRSNTDTTWKIIAGEGQTVRLAFQRFYTEVDHDVVTIYDAAGSQVASLSGYHPEEKVYTSEGFMSVRFTSDASVGTAGFVASYVAAPTALSVAGTGKCKDCGPNGRCVSFLGCSWCVCKFGYHGPDCQPVDPCKKNNGGCPSGKDWVSTCRPSERFHWLPVCECPDGMRGNPWWSCWKVNKCRNGQHSCDKNAECKYNRDGTYSCECREGYEGDGQTCEPEVCGYRLKASMEPEHLKATQGDVGCSWAIESSGTVKLALEHHLKKDETLRVFYGDEEAEGSPLTGKSPGAVSFSHASGINLLLQSSNDAKKRKPNGRMVFEASYVAEDEGCPLDCGDNGVCDDSGDDGAICVCDTGYEFRGGTCVEVDECIESNLCHPYAVCENTEGSYECVCRSGYIGDGLTCYDYDECASGTDECSTEASCSNVDGSYSCTCFPGYAGDGFSCEDINECDAEPSVCENVHAVCTNRPGSYMCSCKTGYQGDGVSCEDIDECQDEPCDPIALCMNTPGSFTCECPSGYTGNGFVCTDINECADGTAECGIEAYCVNKEGSYECICNPGFEGDAYVECKEVDLCPADCSANAECSSSKGTYTCTCLPGFQGNGKTCEDIDECSEGTALCSSNATCTNTVGAYECSCNAGYRGDGRTCDDINECGTGELVCGEYGICKNTPGSYSCSFLPAQVTRIEPAIIPYAGDIVVELHGIRLGLDAEDVVDISYDRYTCSLLNRVSEKLITCKTPKMTMADVYKKVKFIVTTASSGSPGTCDKTVDIIECYPEDRDCAGTCYGSEEYDSCGECGGDASTCLNLALADGSDAENKDQSKNEPGSATIAAATSSAAVVVVLVFVGAAFLLPKNAIFNRGAIGYVPYEDAEETTALAASVALQGTQSLAV